MRSTLIILFLLGVQLIMAQTTFISHETELVVGDDILYSTFLEPPKATTVILFIAGSAQPIVMVTVQQD